MGQGPVNWYTASVMKETFAITFRRPREAVFEIVTDFDKLNEFGGGKVSLQPVEGRPAKGKGSAVRFKSPMPGAGDVVCETIEWDPPKRCVRRLNLTDIPTTLAMDFEEEGGVTKLTVELEIEPKSTMYKMMIPILQGQIAKKKDEVIRTFQAQLDAAA